eukprot:TRINITY_DN672_c0_g1::TRINITY_DN672_c0_g1_i1::g.28862::m.28862 TRINITY_DN672_c0_g1::TRINITY_DN672_c0_g1_i1::g.28862  ORF type:complete len:210 (-),score=11.83,sp/Q05737/YPTM2_MAIZE/44.94/3e-56,Ras/PF00071.17/3.4e-56,Miro/PF08477.8/9.9e-19,Arf/PF00025.16/2.6e-17,Gtr1_RagA/PF04670.7/1.1e-09,GTP_EFTU/PF00009.22/1.8e-06,MMR_HSR1/PF01926.18/0.00041,SRPRB/PF09439.5/0.001,PduV-EutP/PF10662.4/0.047,ATP_bind_1/PF03029.12/19,ATP_bind_1/PF03029.12/1.1,FeoB_N/PF02421.13/0.2,FeoB_N/PF02421.13/4.7e+02,G-alpha/
MSTSSANYLFKILLIGEAAVGKTSLFASFLEQGAPSHYLATIGVDFSVQTVQYKGKTVKLQVWDTGGQERFRSITQQYFRGAHGVMLVYDITKRKTFEALPYWLEDVSKYCTRNDICCILVGNKVDLESQREVRTEEALHYAEQNGLPFLETSALKVYNVQQAFLELVELMLEKFTILPEQGSSTNNPKLSSTKLSIPQETVESSTCAC